MPPGALVLQPKKQTRSPEASYVAATAAAPASGAARARGLGGWVHLGAFWVNGEAWDWGVPA